jgi:hypothetical protein
LDIVSADGLMLLLEAIQGNPIPYRMSSLEWLFQQRPSACSLPFNILAEAILCKQG